MPLPNSRLAYQDCYDLFNQALADDKGIRVAMESEAAAITFRMRMHHARGLDRELNAQVHPKGAPMHGQSVYDPLILRLREDTDDNWWIYIEPNTAQIGEVESLSEVPDAPSA